MLGITLPGLLVGHGSSKERSGAKTPGKRRGTVHTEYALRP